MFRSEDGSVYGWVEQEGEIKVEKCWFADKHKKLGEDPLDCLKCKRMAGKVLIDKPDIPISAAFIDGYRLALIEVASYLNQADHPLSQHHIDMLLGIHLRFCCAIDRGVSIDHLGYVLNSFGDQCMRDLLKGKSSNEKVLRDNLEESGYTN